MSFRAYKELIIVPPGNTRAVFGTLVLNDSSKPMYIRVRSKSFTVSDRRPAAYGVKRVR